MPRLLTIGHSYVVALNRRLAHEMAIAGAGTWEVTAAAPAALSGDLRRITLERFEGEACRVVPCAMGAQRSPHFRVYRGIAGLLREGWDVIHCWEEPYVAAGWQVARGAPPGTRVVFATFQNIAKRYPPPLNWMERSAMRRADGWIAFGRTVHDTLAPLPLYRSRVSRVITPGVDLHRFAPDLAARREVRQRFGWGTDGPVVGFVGRFVAPKGLAVLCDALRAVDAPWKALFVGDGPERPRLDALAAAYPGRVAVAADVAHDGVADYLNAMDLLCAPSQTTAGWREQFGRMLVEAMACGVPVVASDSGEIPHVIEGSGVVVPERDVAAWAREIATLLAAPERRRALAAAGIERARQRFAWPVIARQHLAFFDEVRRR
jgi:glycosyltransferase involved in cell wall biosynthesis